MATTATPAKNHMARWTEDQDEWLWKYIGRLSDIECAERMGRSLGSIRSRLFLLAQRHMAGGSGSESGMSRAAAAEHIGRTEAELQEWMERAAAKAATSRSAGGAKKEKPPSPPWPDQLGARGTGAEEALPELNEAQADIVRAVVTGREGENIFMTGVAGTGKTTTLQAVIRALSAAGKVFGVTAMTGTAAVLFGGQTLHSFLGIGLGKESAAYLAWRTRNNKQMAKRAELLRSIEVLIIDEVSMMDAGLFDLVSEYLSLVRAATPSGTQAQLVPFGGVRLLLSGDMCQLPPVNGEYCFRAASWRAANIQVRMLTRVYRQAGEDPATARFLELLERARWARLTPDDIALLRAAQDTSFPEDSGVVPTRLYPLRRDVEEVNATRFYELVAAGPGPEAVRRYLPIYGRTGASKEVRAQAKAWFEKSQRETSVELCPGAQVMATWNLKKDNVMNGTRGVVIRCHPESVEVRLLDGTVTTIGYQTIAPSDNPHLEVAFLPLQLAWAISIHKSQGMTLDCMEADLGRNVFEYGQAYTALSRARSLAGVRLTAFHPGAFRTHPDVLRFYKMGPPGSAPIPPA